eukprot:GHRQ01013105.1.p1 GENE.GHRQ01013105.1~~GHRQ01013105.1.p1  ORF type:complete len:212 (+),score=97.34 GHRQ01013105.1:546-1181(+)
MPKRATIIFTSNDGPRQEGPGLFVYYCKYSGKHAFTTDVDIDTLPLRRTDNARILDKTKHVVKLYTSDAGTKLLRRKDGSVERQHRLSVGSLPVAYTSDGSSDILYIMDRAVTSYNRDAGAGDRVPVPPCIRVGESGNVEVTLEIEDREKHVTIGKITADAVRVHITGALITTAAASSSSTDISYTVHGSRRGAAVMACRWQLLGNACDMV